MTKIRLLSAALCGTLVFLLAGCAAPVSKPERSGFLSDYSRLEMVEEGKINYFVDEMTEQLTRDDGYAVVTKPGSGVARFRIGLTEVDKTEGALNVAIYTKVRGAGLDKLHGR